MGFHLISYSPLHSQPLQTLISKLEQGFSFLRLQVIDNVNKLQNEVLFGMEN